jgi:class 3 adenylate cyclase
MPASEDRAGDGEGTAAILRELGVPEDAIRRALERGDPEGAVLESVMLPGQAARTVSAAEVEAQGGLPAHEILEILQAMGFPPPDAHEPALTPEEARVFVELAALREVWPHELSQQLARMYGRLLARIARTGVQFVRLYAEPRVREMSTTREEQLAALREAFERLLTLPDPLLVGVHRRWLEYELAQSAAAAAQAHAPGPELAGAMEVSLLFCDLKDFTAYANAEGDVAAVEAIDAFAQTVYAERGEGGSVVKALGDGHMLRYGDPREAVAAGARIIVAMRGRDMLGVHASVHRGIVIAREGDYFGSAVNLAARLLAAAGRDELVATAPVAGACDDNVEWEPLGVRRIRGVTEPVEVFRLRAVEVAARA